MCVEGRFLDSWIWNRKIRNLNNWIPDLLIFLSAFTFIVLKKGSICLVRLDLSSLPGYNV